MYVLGISSFYHDSAACLVKDGEVIAAAHEERFTRKKHDKSFPKEAIKYCLNEAKISAETVDYIAYYDKPLLKFERLLNQFIETFPWSFETFVKSIPFWLNEKLLVKKELRKLGFKGKTFFLEHHLSHASATFLPSPFKEAAVLTIDGVGEWSTTSMGRGKDNQIEIIKEINFPHSLGLLYSAITAYLGFRVNNSEYKVMGLAPYGKPAYLDKFRKIIKVHDDASYSLDMSYFDYLHAERMPSKKLERLFGQPTRKAETELTQFHKDVAASLQAITEEVLFKLVNHLQKETGLKDLCLGGGVALNSVANGKILSKTGFERIWIQPAAGDAGSAMGAALYVYNSVLNNKRSYRLDSAFLGPGYSNQEIKKYLDDNRIKYTVFKNDQELTRATARLIAKNNVIGWFQGRMEWGPRALGSRSILSNPCEPNMQDILNLKVKHREKFRPFAPVITLEATKDWFECDTPVPEPADYMLMVYPIKKGKRKIIPSVTHVDGSGRLQVIRKNQNPLYYQTIKEFEKITGVPILINTSFNIRGEPIVCTPYHAYRCMMGTGIDYLVMGHYLIKRDDNPRDMWDSEKLAKD